MSLQLPNWGAIVSIKVTLKEQTEVLFEASVTLIEIKWLVLLPDILEPTIGVWL